MLKDRGTIKWTSLMLPEHVEELKKLWEEHEQTPFPLLDEQELQELGRKCIEAYNNEEIVQLTAHETGHSKIYKGKIVKLDQQNGLLSLKTASSTEKIPFKKLIDIQNGVL